MVKIWVDLYPEISNSFYLNIIVFIENNLIRTDLFVNIRENLLEHFPEYNAEKRLFFWIASKI